MKRPDIDELHYIAPIASVPSIVKLGLLSHKRAAQVVHESIAMPEIQERRARKVVPGGRPLHEYVNLYFCGRNPMLYKRKAQHSGLCVLRLRTTVLDLPGVVIADGNAASDYTAFWPSPSGLARVDKELVFAEYWTDPDMIAYFRKKDAKCAEVLVPNQVDPGYIIGAYVSCPESMQIFQTTVPGLEVSVDAHLFFRT